MAGPSVRFETGNARWVPDRDSVGFTGTTDFGPVEFLVTSEALAELLDPALDGIDWQTAIETFMEFEGEIQRIARRQFVRRLGGEPPILLTAADLESRADS